ncbi:MAG: GreA/GreB family elongation factor [Clostridiales bacterium]|nr:GreA/GreB family elongation factor [Clostridiales bacterium]
MNKQNTVQCGSTVVVRREFTTEQKTYHISSYTDLSRNIVSAEHPIGKGLLNHEKGDKALIDDPKLYYFVEILDIKNPTE